MACKMMSVVFEAASSERSGRFESAAVIVKFVNLMLILTKAFWTGDVQLVNEFSGILIESCSCLCDKA